jgi:4-amino-4-deoxy-L-arabinose transferase-like glycosyltransferase
MQIQLRNNAAVQLPSPQTRTVFLWDTHHPLLYAFLILGIALRLFHYADNRSLWLDEIYLSSGLLHMDFAELARPVLDYQQKAPIGYLWLAKASTMLLGNNEPALRLPSLLAGIAALVLFVPLCRHLLGRQASWVAMALLALAPYLVFHGVEAKQYSTDLLATIAALLVYLNYRRERSGKNLAGMTLTGCLLIFLSFPVIFILGGVLLAEGVKMISARRWQAFLPMLLPAFCWLLLFSLNLYLSYTKAYSSDWLLHWFDMRGGFIKLPPRNLAEAAQPFQVAGSRVLAYPLGLIWDLPARSTLADYLLNRPLVALACLATGALVFFRKDRNLLLLLLAPFLLALAASALRRYPLFERLTVFLSPLLILLLAAGCSYWQHRLQGRLRLAWLPPLLLLAPAAWTSLQQAVDTDRFGDTKKAYFRESFSYVSQQFRPGDTTYFYWNVTAPLTVYRRMTDWNFAASPGKDERYGAGSLQAYMARLASHLAPYAGRPRVWVLYSKTQFVEIGDYYGDPAWYFQGGLGGRALQKVLNQTGRELQRFETHDMVAALYDFSGKGQPANRRQANLP